MKTKFYLAILTISFLLIRPNAHATLIETGGDPANGSAYITFQEDVIFEISPAGSGHAVIAFVIDEAVPTSDGARNILGISGLTYSVNGGTPYSLTSWNDNAAPDGDIGENDSFLSNFIGPWVTEGDIVTLHAGTATVTASDSSFNLFASGDYTMFLVNDASFRISYDAIPEPSSIGLVSISAAAIVFIRKRLRV